MEKQEERWRKGILSKFTSLDGREEKQKEKNAKVGVVGNIYEMRPLPRSCS